MSADQPLSIHTGCGRVWTFGLSFLGHPELSAETSSFASVDEACSTLQGLASRVLAGSAWLRPGDTVTLRRRLLRLVPGSGGSLQLVAVPRSEALCQGRGGLAERAVFAEGMGSSARE